METPRPGLPTDILAEIVAALDPVQDRHCLLNLMSTSSTVWDLAARQLYGNLSVDNEQLAQLVASGKNLSSRSRKVLTFVRRLRICPQLTTATILLLWKVALLNKPLFPNVRQLIYLDHLDPHDSDKASQRLWALRQQRRVSPKVFIFDAADVCITGRGYHQVFLLPIRTLRNITFHESGHHGIFRWGFPPSWTSFRVFDNTFHLCSLGDKWERYGWLLDAVEKLNWKGLELQPRIQICWLSDDPVPPILDEMEAGIESDMPEWRPSTSGFEFRVYSREEPRNCPPCGLCGECRACFDTRIYVVVDI